MCTDLCTFGVTGTVDRAGRPGLRVLLSGLLGQPGGRPEAPTVGFLTVGGRPAGRPAALTDPNGYIFLAYKLGGLVIVLSQDFRDS